MSSDVENLDLAIAYGFNSFLFSNERMGAKWNAGFAFAADHGADYFVLVGSDDWIHPDNFEQLPLGAVAAASSLDFVDLERGVVQHAHAEHLLPWIVPRPLLEPTEFRPFPDRMQRGTETMLRGALGMPDFVKIGGTPLVDFKTAESVSPYAGVRNSTGDGHEHDLSVLNYPAHLVEAARLVYEEIA